MSTRTRLLIFAASGLVAAYAVWVALSPEINWHAPAWKLMVTFALFWIGYFVALLPVWLPAAVPYKWPGITRVARLMCGATLLACALAFVVADFDSPLFGWLDVALALALAAIGVWHLTLVRADVPQAARRST